MTEGGSGSDERGRCGNDDEGVRERRVVQTSPEAGIQCPDRLATSPGHQLTIGWAMIHRLVAV